ncbi:GCR3 protein [Scheffersomyces xylosifermentans]|uniref:GCR3 protein n=1 Tax=Scheffersomyces xylosifermentans TaxID=1304137 RepID=UPI00315CDD6F
MDSHPGKRTRDEFEADQGPPQHFDEDSESKRQHIDPAQELINNVCKDIRRLGENPNIINQIEDVSYISNPIVAEFEKIDKLRNSILSTVYALIIEQPQKINALSNLVLICNAKNFVVAKYVVEYLHAKAQALLDTIRVVPEEGAEKKTEKKSKSALEEDAGTFNNLKSILKFLATLAPIIESYSIVNLYKQFLTLAIELQDSTPEIRNGIAQEIFYNVLIAIPYLLSNDNSEELIDRVNELVELAKDFKVVEISSNVLLQPFDSKLENYKLPYEPVKMIDLIYKAISDLQGEDKKWENLQNKLFLNFSELVQPIIKEALENNPISNEVIKHQLPQLSLPSVEQVQSYKPTGSIDKLWKENSRVLFQVYNATEFETVPKIDTYFGLFFKDLSFDILTNLSFNKNEASIQLSILDLFFSKDLFAPPGSSIDQLSMIHEDNKSGENLPPLSTWKIEDIAVESILTMIFQLPVTLHREIYYYTVLIACCKESPDSIAPVFGRAIRYFYNNLETLDYELKMRFLDWMTTQISNFDFSWKWDEWVNDSKKFKNLKFHPKKNFIKNLIAKEVRLSNKKRIGESFVTVDPETSDIVSLEEFNQYLNISLFDDEEKYILDYDTSLFQKEEVREVLQKLYNEKKDQLAAKPAVFAQEEIFYNFSHPELPLNAVSSKVYDFVVAHWKPNNEFNDLCKEIVKAAEEFPEINAQRFLVNIIFQTYAYIGSRSIYSVVSILSRDVNKLKYLSGSTIEYGHEEPKFEEAELTPEEINDRQNWIIESIFRVWVHQPQEVFLILEYLIEFDVLKPDVLVKKTLDLEHNLILGNVSCMESINRVLNNSFVAEDPESFKKLVLILFTSITNNLNVLSKSLQSDSSEIIKISQEFEDPEDMEAMKKVDQEWLFFEYKGLLKSYFRRYVKNHDIDYLDEIKQLLESIENVPAKEDTLKWLDEVSK